jgi:hypothetical protein
MVFIQSSHRLLAFQVTKKGKFVGYENYQLLLNATVVRDLDKLQRCWNDNSHNNVPPESHSAQRTAAVTRRDT